MPENRRKTDSKYLKKVQTKLAQYLAGHTERNQGDYGCGLQYPAFSPINIKHMNRNKIEELFGASQKPDGLCLAVVSGSHAYGLENENSDLDIRGVFVCMAESILLQKATAAFESEDGDTVYQPLPKFMKLAAAGNPNVLEWLFTSDQDILFCNVFGKMLLENRSAFLSRRIIASYGGYRTSSMKMLEKMLDQDGIRGVPEIRKRKAEKICRHILRLSVQELQLLEKGNMSLYCPEADIHFELTDDGFWIPPANFYQQIKELEEAIDTAQRTTSLHEEPDWNTLNHLLEKINLEVILQFAGLKD